MYLAMEQSIFVSLFCCRDIGRADIVSKWEEPYVENKEDTYLTLEILAAILEELFKPGRSIRC